MITKTAIGLLEGGLFAMPHVMDYMDDNKSIPGAVLGTAGDIAAVRASDAIFDKVFKPNNYNFFQNAPQGTPWYKFWKHMKPTKNFEWAKALRNGAGRFAFATPFFMAGSMATDAISNKLFPGKNQRMMQQYQANMQQPYHPVLYNSQAIPNRIQGMMGAMPRQQPMQPMQQGI